MGSKSMISNGLCRTVVYMLLAGLLWCPGRLAAQEAAQAEAAGESGPGEDGTPAAEQPGDAKAAPGEVPAADEKADAPDAAAADAEAMPADPEAEAMDEDVEEGPEEDEPAKAEKKPAPEPPLPVWTSRGGDMLQAEFVEYRYGRVVLKNADGNMIQIHISALIPEDQARVKALHEAAQAGPQFETEPSKSDRLPVYLTGKWTGYHGAYEGKTYEVGITAQGDLHIFLKKKGDERLDGKFPVVQRWRYHNVKKRHHRARRIVSFDSYEEPSTRIKEIEFNAMLDDGVHATYGYEFEPDELKVWGWIDDPGDIEWPTWYRIVFRLPQRHNIPDDITVAGLREMVKGNELEIEPKEGEKVLYNYHEGLQRLPTPADKVWIRGPIIAPREFEIDALSRVNAWLHPHIYRGYAPWRGFSVWLSKKDPESKSRAEAMVITIE